MVVKTYSIKCKIYLHMAYYCVGCNVLLYGGMLLAVSKNLTAS
ncbi:hypothetical protein CRENPOLYSF1_590003 [Crenothrix polyspora]|uniref:Uncharacterized protein n=1 Tax=Crenothrix polyspora TaxID=360316 RepID=A0A1R4HF33_9GAMM|nr:hypothetical protein CRENPOLYSF1_590003 [Crenothrix polyspora]